MSVTQDLFTLKNKTALITGATGSLGKVICHTLSELGANLYIVDLKFSRLEELGNKLQSKYHQEVVPIACNLEHEEERMTLMDTIKKNKDSLDILINNAAFVGASDLEGWSVPFEQQSIATWRRALEVNLTASFHLCQGLSPLLSNSASGSIINISSIYGCYGPDWRLYDGTSMSNPAAYAASKGSMVQLSRWLATTLAPKVRVNTISPGGIKRGQPESFINKYEQRTPMGRMATEEDFRGVIAFLASTASGYITGQNIMVDGGWGVW